MIKRPTIGLCVISKNEAHNLPRLLDSVKDCVDEIYLTDTGSTDSTVQIATEYGAHVSHFTWVNDFSAARNFNFSQAKTDFILWLDCDDSLGHPEEFKNWRDTMMILGDYHLAPYWYSIDAAGAPTCQFTRERVVKNNWFKWKYAIHEGMTPDTNMGQPKCLQSKGWHVIHHRTEEDLKKDKGRNLDILEKQPELDARLTYYYGKELFEADRTTDCIAPLEKALCNPKLELHDRIVGMQYLCYAFLRKSRDAEEAKDEVTKNTFLEKAISMALTALQISPSRAEFFTIIGDSFIKKHDLVNAVPFYAASKAAILDMGSPVNAAIFHNKDLYTTYPRNQLCRIYANLGDTARAKLEAKDCGVKFGNAEAKALYFDLDQMTQPKEVTAKTEVDEIVISCPMQAPYLWDGKVYRERAMGGSETAAIEMGEWLAKLSGKKVKIFNERETALTWNGVEYIPATQLGEYFDKNVPFLHIAWRHNVPLTDPKRTFLWCHDLFTPGGEAADKYNKILALTPFHRRFLMVNQGISNEKIHVTRNGLNVSKFSNLDTIQRDPFKFVFSSSPDRGLDRAIRVLSKVRETYPQVKLHVYYGISHLHKYGQAALQEKLKTMMEENSDWIVYHGATPQDKLMKEFASAAYCVQPSDFIETSMISALERACCGVYQVIREIGGCVDTLAPVAEKGMAKLVFSECITEAEHEVYAQEVIRCIKEEAYKRVSVDVEPYSWEHVAREWLEQLPKMI